MKESTKDLAPRSELVTVGTQKKYFVANTYSSMISIAMPIELTGQFWGTAARTHDVEFLELDATKETDPSL
jgi:hypothetical protein